MSAASKSSIRIPEELFEHMQTAVEWVAEKLEAEELFDILALVLYDGDEERTVYQGESLELAWREFESVVSDPDEEVVGYVAATDVTVSGPRGRVRGALMRVEHKDLRGAQQFFHPLTIEEDIVDGIMVEIGEGPFHMGGDKPYLKFEK